VYLQGVRSCYISTISFDPVVVEYTYNLLVGWDAAENSDESKSQVVLSDVSRCG